MALKNYETEINGITHTFQLEDEDAVRRGLDPAKDSKGDAELATSPQEFGEPTTDGQDTETKSRTASNKSRAAADK